MDIKTFSEYNNLLSTPERLSTYLVLYYASIEKQKLDIQAITNKINKKWECGLSYHQVKYVLDLFVKVGIVEKDIKKGIHVHYLTKKIYVPPHSSPIPFYQLIILTTAFLFLSYSYIVNDNKILLMSFASFLTSLIMVTMHQFMFEIDRLRSSKQILKKVININKKSTTEE